MVKNNFKVSRDCSQDIHFKNKILKLEINWLIREDEIGCSWIKAKKK